MNDLITIQGTRVYLDDSGTAHLNLEDVARGLGFTESKGGVEYVMWRRVQGYLNEFGYSAQVPKDGFIPENIFYKLCFKASNATARALQDVVTDEILPTIRKTGGFVANDEMFINTYMPYAEESTKHLFRLQLAAQRENNKRISALKEENEMLEVALDESSQYCSVRRYNIMHGMNWTLRQCQRVGKMLSEYCRARRIDPRKIPDERFNLVNSYPITAWEGFMEEVRT
jgi:prophage antirepressor-like protein